jgi:hypothetical protein
MSFASDLFSAVTGDATLAGLIGDRLFPDLLPQADGLASCSLVYKEVTAVKEQSNDGDSRLRKATVQFDVYSTVREEIQPVIDALCALFIPFKGMMGETPVGAIFHVHDSKNYEPETRLYRGSVDFDFWHQT